MEELGLKPCLLAQSPPSSAVMSLLVALVRTYEPHLLSQLEPPYLALYSSFCFRCICPVWTIGV